MANPTTAQTHAIVTGTTGGDKRVPGHTIQQWAVDLINAINAYGFKIPVNATTVGIFITWANTESSGYNPNRSGGRNNPLNTTETSQGGVSGQGGSQGNIADFATYEDGIKNQAYNLARAGGTNDAFGYRNILGHLQILDVPGTFAAINASSFGTHFGSGAAPAATSGSLSGSSGQTATLTSATSTVQSWVSHIPVFGGLLSAGLWPARLAEATLKIFVNWRYVVQVWLGITMMVAGTVLIVMDTKPAKQAGQAAMIAAAA